MKKVIALNYKNFPQAFGDTGLERTKAAARLAESFHEVEIIICPPTPFLSIHASHAAPAVLFAQHADSKPEGQSTGWIPWSVLKNAGCSGSLVNHAEKKLGVSEVGKVVEEGKKIGMRVIACADSLGEARELARFSPWAIAVEPPELIGSGVSISTAQPDIVKNAVAEIKHIDSEIRVLVGAGVSNSHDVRRAIELGSEGVLLASAFVKAASPQALLKEMLEAI